MEYALIVNTEDCVGCHACEIACKQEHNLPVGPRWIKVSSDGTIEAESKRRFKYTAAHCLHCSRPACLEICPAKAIVRREDGIVIIDEEACIGCRDCIQGCPLGAIEFDEKQEKAQKCDLCVDRLERGLPPACVAACPSHCIYFGNIAEVVAKLPDKKFLLQYKSV
ncbi:MAG: 4Fe-4S dicluster domain-containing protein [Chloroflexota bacterium]